jgi:hypothetical protein
VDSALWNWDLDALALKPQNQPTPELAARIPLGSRLRLDESADNYGAVSE